MGAWGASTPLDCHRRFNLCTQVEIGGGMSYVHTRSRTNPGTGPSATYTPSLDKRQGRLMAVRTPTQNTWVDAAVSPWNPAYERNAMLVHKRSGHDVRADAVVGEKHSLSHAEHAAVLGNVSGSRHASLEVCTPAGDYHPASAAPLFTWVISGSTLRATSAKEAPRGCRPTPKRQTRSKFFTHMAHNSRCK